jgi:hypothetical protein
MCLCGLFNLAISTSYYIVLDDRIVNEELIGKDVEGSSCGLR